MATTLEALDRMLEVTEGRFFGKYRGTVEDNNDPTGRGRLSVRVPAVFGDTPVWALPCVPYAGDGVGFYAIPAVSTPVWVEFEAGDPSFPIWVGCFWKDGEIPAGDAKPEVKFFRTSKITIRIDDSEGSIEISSPQGSSLKLTASEIAQSSQTVSLQAGSNKVALTAMSFDVNNGAFTVV